MKVWFTITLLYAVYIFLTTDNIFQAFTTLIVWYAFGYLLYLFLALLRNILGRKRSQCSISFKEIDVMTGSDFEVFVAKLYQQLGYKTQKTPDTGDFGADVIAENRKEILAIQCKRYRKAVGVSAIQEIVAALPVYHATQGVVITNSYFTPAAKKLAQANHIQLIDRRFLAKLIDRKN